MEKAEKYSKRAIYQRIPGMYNEKIVEADFINMNNLSDNIRAVEYDTNIENIKKWVEEKEKFKSEIESFKKAKGETDSQENLYIN
ncbi:MAG: hypothetical protein HWN81_01800 [Candidatus Lokiarchaeota archaeon]|nr:hypothetical protein [Candidatus Lokiarchaeota archaeon]